MGWEHIKNAAGCMPTAYILTADQYLLCGASTCLARGLPSSLAAKPHLCVDPPAEQWSQGQMNEVPEQFFLAQAKLRDG